MQGVADNTRPVCGPGTTSTPSTFESSDPLDLDGDGATSENYCQWAASLTVPPSGGPAFGLVKTVQGDLDSAPKYSPGIGDASQAGSGVYTLKWSNTGGKNLTNPVIYDILPYVGDTGVSQGQASVTGGSQFATIFAGISGPLPSGVTVAYSMSTNPCRPEVYPNAANPGCVNDWTTTAPSDLGLVKALRFTATGTYTPSQSFTVALTVSVPAGYLNTVAWNSAASDASYNGSALLPAEPPKVGLTAPAPPLTPTLSTSSSAPDVQPGDAFSDAILVGNTGGASGTLAWSLVGPVAPAANGTCAALDRSGAATVDSGTIPFSGDGTYTTSSSAPTGAGCYSYVGQLTGTAFEGPATSPVGSPGETVLVHAATLATTASAVRILPGGAVTDRIQLGGTGTGTVDWQLVGPVAPAANGTCNDLDWSHAATIDSGTLAVSGDGTYTTSTSNPTATGCYSYVELLTASSVGGPATSPAGSPGETVLVARPTLGTTVSSASVLTGGTVSDVIDVGGTGGAPGSIDWQLLGPVAPAANGSCSGVSWSGAAIADHGTITVTGDGVYTTPASKLTAAGCYGYAATLTGAAYGGPVTTRAGAAGEVAQAKARPLPPPQQVHVTIQKRVNHKSITLGNSLTYTLSIENTGPDTATGVKVTDTPDTKMRLRSAKTTTGTCAKGLPLTCQLGPLPPGGHATITIVAVPLAAGANVDHAHVSTGQINTAPAKDVLAAADTEVKVPLRLTKTPSARTVHAGGRVRYTILVANPTSVTARSVSVCDRLPAGLVFVSASVKTRLRTGSLCWTITSIAPHARKAYTIAVRALPGASGDANNKVSISGAAIASRQADARVRVLRARSRPISVTG